MSEIVENFYGCYLLVSENERYKNYTYIGFTVDPNRRINQHNRGVKSGGAKYTQNKGPWNMVLIIHGFPNEISALRFEWAWQHPHRSTRLRSVSTKMSKETRLAYRFRILGVMLSTGPWDRLPLTIRWLKPEFAVHFQASPPLHMPVTEGDVESKKVPDVEINDDSVSANCIICDKIIEDPDDSFECFLPNCDMKGHIFCLAKKSSDDFLIPVEIKCPKCKKSVLWGDLVRYKKGCYRFLK